MKYECYQLLYNIVCRLMNSPPCDVNISWVRERDICPVRSHPFIHLRSEMSPACTPRLWQWSRIIAWSGIQGQV